VSPQQSSDPAGEPSGDDLRAIRTTGELAGGLVEVEVCAVDADWSGLKFVVRRAERGARGGTSARRTGSRTPKGKRT
jgi:hypothetical protein